MDQAIGRTNMILDKGRLLTSCRVCDSKDLELAIDLGYQPWCGHFLKKEELGTEPQYPLRVLFCYACGTPQLDYTIPKEVMFSDHTYLSNITRTLSDHFRNLAGEINERFFKSAPYKSILDIGSNDGMQLRHYKNLGYDILGVESAKTAAKIANDSGIPTANEFFNHDFVKRLGRKFDVVNASGVLFHLEELHSVLDGVKDALAEDGVFLIQFLYMRRIMENMAFDQIYHEHLLYYNLSNLQTLLKLHGLELFDAYLSPIHGGSMIGFAMHTGKQNIASRLQGLLGEEKRDGMGALETYQAFARKIEEMKKKNLAYLNDMKARGKRMFGFGAPAKGNTMLNYFGVGREYLEYLTEKNELRRGLYSPGTHIPIVIEKEFDEVPDIYYVLAWNFKNEILANNKHLADKGIEFYFPVDPKEI